MFRSSVLFLGASRKYGIVFVYAFRLKKNLHEVVKILSNSVENPKYWRAITSMHVFGYLIRVFAFHSSFDHNWQTKNRIIANKD